METTAETVTKTLIVKTRGRQYFTCVLSGYKALLVIDDVTRDLELDRIVTIEAEDQSVKTKYGSTLKFRAISITGDRSAAEAREAAASRKDAEKWLRYAEEHVASGLTRTRSVAEALRLAPEHEHLADRLAALKAQIRTVLAEEPAREAARWLGYAESDAASGLTRTNAIREALTRAPKHPELADRLTALKAAIAAEQAAAAAPARRTTLLLQHPQLNVPESLNGHVVVFTGEKGTRRVDEDDPSVYGSHLLGEEGSWAVIVEYRNATPDETAVWEQQQTETQARRDHAVALNSEAASIAHRIRTEGHRPPSPAQPTGEPLCGHPDLHGGGAWFVIEPEAIWLVENNGADGDDWSLNNVHTGGAGAIGWRVPEDREVAQRIRELHEQGALL